MGSAVAGWCTLDNGSNGDFKGFPAGIDVLDETLAALEESFGVLGWILPAPSESGGNVPMTGEFVAEACVEAI